MNSLKNVRIYYIDGAREEYLGVTYTLEAGAVVIYNEKIGNTHIVPFNNVRKIRIEANSGGTR